MSVTANPPGPPVREDKKPSALLSFVKRNPFTTLWNTALIASALIFTVYFVEIRFIPDFDVTALFGLVAIAALLGAGTVFFLAMLLLFPGLWSGWIVRQWVSSHEKSTVGEPHQSESINRESLGERKRFFVILLISYPTSCYIIFFTKNYDFLLVTPIAIILIPMVWGCRLIPITWEYFTRKKGRKQLKNQQETKITPASQAGTKQWWIACFGKAKECWRKTKSVYHLMFLLVSGLWIFSSVYSFVAASYLFSGTPLMNHYSSISRVVVIIAFVFAINFFIAAFILTDAPFQPEVKVFAIVMGVILLLLSLSHISNAIVNRLSLGNIRAIDVTATAAGCRALRSNGVDTQALPGKACEAKSLQLLSRVGTQFFLKKADAGELAQKKSAGGKADADNHAPKDPCTKEPGACFVLKKADVLSWSIIDPAPIFTAASQNRHHGKSNSTHENPH
ncbi:MAG TPA: hypothetical protein DEP05_08515 [Betaproteobacteria bacterium]|nr:hypothetical protein [Betaproteobacteria bacterium]